MALSYNEMSREELKQEYAALQSAYEDIKAKGLKLDISRGKPGVDQLNLTNEMLTHCLDGDHISEDGIDCRNYGVLDGIAEAKRLFLQMLGVSEKEIIVGGNSSLQLMYDTVARSMLLGVWDEASPSGRGRPWREAGQVRFLCPCPGYDRHFAICESMGIEMIPVPMNKYGPDMGMIESFVARDDGIKGVWCVPMYSNPEGVTYSDEVVRRFANLNPKSGDFRIFWDNAYAVHHLNDEPDRLLNILDECKKTGKQDMVYIFSSTSKISFPGGGVAMVAASEANIDFLKKQMSFQTIGYDKLNQLRHAKFFKDYDGILEHMKKHREILAPKFKIVLTALETRLKPLGVGEWREPRGGYFVSYNGPDRTAKRTVALCKEAGLVLTDAGATYPYGRDPRDRNIRIAPTYPGTDELSFGMEVFCLCAKLAAAEQLLAE